MRVNPHELEARLSENQTGVLFDHFQPARYCPLQIPDWYRSFCAVAVTDFNWSQHPLPWEQLRLLLMQNQGVFLWTAPTGFIVYTVPADGTHVEWLMVYTPFDFLCFIKDMVSAQHWLQQSGIVDRGKPYTSLQWAVGPLHHPWAVYLPRMGLQFSTQITLQFDATNPLQQSVFQRVAETQHAPTDVTFRWLISHDDTLVFTLTTVETAVIALLLKSYEHSTDMVWDPRMQSLAGMHHLWQAAIQTADITGFGLAYRNGSLIGVTVWTRHDTDSALAFWAVDPDCQRQGVGPWLLNHSLSHWLKNTSDPVSPIKTATSSLHTRAIRLYRQCGWQLIDATVIGYAP